MAKIWNCQCCGWKGETEIAYCRGCGQPFEAKKQEAEPDGMTMVMEDANITQDVPVPSSDALDLNLTMVSTSFKASALNQTMVESVVKSKTSTRSSTRIIPDKPPAKLGPFEILKELGRGGMGAVYLAYEPLLNRKVALKVLNIKGGAEQQTRECARFLLEAVLTGRLGHSGIIPIYQIDFDQTYGYYYTMRYLDGRTLEKIYEDLESEKSEVREEFSQAAMLRIILRVCEAMAFAHREQIIHRDLKPANIMITEFGETLILDWGLAKGLGVNHDAEEEKFGKEFATQMEKCRRRRNSSTRLFLAQKDDDRLRGKGTKRLQAIKAAVEQEKPEKLTNANEIVGTPSYVSPEQARGDEDLTTASDVYALGVLLYELLTGRLPVDSTDPMEMVVKTAMGKIVPIEKRDEAIKLPRALCDIVNHALAFDPAKRLKNAGELAEELRLYLEGRSALKRVVEENFSEDSLGEQWSERKGHVTLVSSEGCQMKAGAWLRSERYCMGSFRCHLDLTGSGPGGRWGVSIRICEVEGKAVGTPRYEIRLGVAERAYVELWRNGERIRRHMDIRMQSEKKYHVRLEIEQDKLGLWIEDEKTLEFRELFPQSGGAVEIGAHQGTVTLHHFSLWSRGAPLQLSFMVLPDQMYRMGRYEEARRLYRQLAESHPDREEGLMALFKAGLCSTELTETQEAFEEFAKLEGTMYDHCCALGLARIGMVDGSIDWAWEALKNGFLCHRGQEIRTEMWFALVQLIESLGDEQYEEQIRRLRELNDELDLKPDERRQVAYDLLDIAWRNGGAVVLRREAGALLNLSEGAEIVTTEALMALWRAGVDEGSLNHVSEVLERALGWEMPDTSWAQFQLMFAELQIAKGNFKEAQKQLNSLAAYVGRGRPDGLWAEGWAILTEILNEDYRTALRKAHEFQALHRKSRLSQVVYVILLEAISYLGRSKLANAEQVLAKACSYNGIWAKTADSFLKGDSPAEFESTLAEFNGNQMMEAAFLCGEGHRLAGREKPAAAYYLWCLNHSSSRAMITKFARERLDRVSGGREMSLEGACADPG